VTHESAVEDDRRALAQRTVVQVDLEGTVGLLNNNAALRQGQALRALLSLPSSALLHPVDPCHTNGVP
jgi:hypothetical protein